jgi:hypothetical protein
MLKATPITRKASSACKINMDLVKGDREVQKKMTNKVGLSEAAKSAGRALGAVDPKNSQTGGDVEPKSNQTGGDVDSTSTDTDPAPPKMRRSPAKLDPMTIMKVASVASSVMGNKKKDSNGGGKQETKVIVNNAPASSGRNSQAANAIEPNNKTYI